MNIGSESITQYYHPLGGIEKYDFSNGEDLSYSYYSTGLSSSRQLANYTVSFAYDDLGNRTQTTDSFGLTVNYQYDNLNRLASINSDGKTFDYEYYADGMIKAVNYPNGNKGTVLMLHYATRCNGKTV